MGECIYDVKLILYQYKNDIQSKGKKISSDLNDISQTENKHIQMDLASLALRELQFKIIIGCHD